MTVTHVLIRVIRGLEIGSPSHWFTTFPPLAAFPSDSSVKVSRRLEVSPDYCEGRNAASSCTRSRSD
ncbi:hypothetical protein FQA47_005060 [Oryzias melastigma]|uniref:Uncharacterized protein n=1 Tax=Oryzias melastigma TaxID=30732 RepID=A0A834FSL9_ORYME|nr:hypothetical protein FQA47_005060 [Oryzias melastigma]